MTIRETFTRFDPVLLGCVLLLSALSLVLLATDAASDSGGFFVRQSIFVASGLALLFAVARFHYASIRSLAPAAYLVVLALLGVLLMMNGEGVARWISVGGLFQIQPSEFAKAALVIILARVLSAKRSSPMSIGVLLRTIVLAAVPAVMIALQPDFGTAALLGVIWFGMVVVGGISRRQLMVLAVVGTVAAASVWLWGLQGYQQERIRVFLNPGSDPLGSGYTVIQSMTAFGSGGMWGRGLGYGPQSRLEFLPEHRTDFIFARIGEEFGLIGATGVITLYGVLLYRILAAARQTSDPFGSALAVGVFVTLLSGLFVNAGMNIGILPVTGVPLPFISYGGSSMITMFFLMAVVQSVRIYGERWEGEEQVDDEGAGLTRSPDVVSWKV